jgi:hypothetical protein
MASIFFMSCFRIAVADTNNRGKAVNRNVKKIARLPFEIRPHVLSWPGIRHSPDGKYKIGLPPPCGLRSRKLNRPAHNLLETAHGEGSASVWRQHRTVLGRVKYYRPGLPGIEIRMSGALRNVPRKIFE